MSNLPGKKFGLLEVKEATEQRASDGCIMWLCKCDCGNTNIVSTNDLNTGNTRSCGCMGKDHGMSGTRFYNIWRSIKDKCDNPNHNSYSRYGGRGIGYCSRWSQFKAFMADMLDSYKIHRKEHDTTQIERINNDGGYCPENCKWATRKEQGRNTRKNRMLEFRDEKKPMSQWAEELGINYSTLNKRINGMNWSTKKALSTPVDKRYSRDK